MFKRKISISLEKEAFGLKRAVVLAGGGSRGAYQIGVWKAMIQLGMDYQIVTGSSVGSLNGALMVQGDYERAKSLWEQLSYENVIAMKEPPQLETERQRRKMFTSFAREALEKGGLDVLPLEELVRQTVDEKSIRRSSVDFGLVTVEYPSFRPVQLDKNQIPARCSVTTFWPLPPVFLPSKRKTLTAKLLLTVDIMTTCQLTWLSLWGRKRSLP